MGGFGWRKVGEKNVITISKIFLQNMLNIEAF